MHGNTKLKKYLNLVFLFGKGFDNFPKNVFIFKDYFVVFNTRHLTVLMKLRIRHVIHDGQDLLEL
jgi:hypothetical protein